MKKLLSSSATKTEIYELCSEKIHALTNSEKLHFRGLEEGRRAAFASERSQIKCKPIWIFFNFVLFIIE